MEVLIIRKAFYGLLFILFLSSCNKSIDNGVRMESSTTDSKQGVSQGGESNHSYGHSSHLNTPSENTEESSTRTEEGLEEPQEQTQVSPSSREELDEESQEQAQASPSSREELDEEGEVSQANSLIPFVSYADQSIGNIDFNITKERADQLLTLVKEEDNVSLYKEGVSIEWDAEGKAIKLATSIGILKPDKDSSLGLPLGMSVSANGRLAWLRQSYFNLEGEDINCIEEKKCFLSRLKFDLVIIFFPKMWFLFHQSDPETFVLVQAGFEKDNLGYESFLQKVKDESSSGPSSENTEESSTRTEEGLEEPQEQIQVSPSSSEELDEESQASPVSVEELAEEFEEREESEERKESQE